MIGLSVFVLAVPGLAIKSKLRPEAYRTSLAWQNGVAERLIGSIRREVWIT